MVESKFCDTCFQTMRRYPSILYIKSFLKGHLLSYNSSDGGTCERDVFCYLPAFLQNLFSQKIDDIFVVSRSDNARHLINTNILIKQGGYPVFFYYLNSNKVCLIKASWIQQRHFELLPHFMFTTCYFQILDYVPKSMSI